MKKLLFFSGVILATASSSLLGVTVSVDSMSNVFEAGLGTSGTAVGSSLGLYPVLGVSIIPGAGQTISFDSITGTVKYGSSESDPSVPPDGVTNPFGTAG